MNTDDKRITNLLRCLSIDMINKKEYGNSNMCISAASTIYTLFSRHMNISINDTKWINRDRFICTSKELSPLIYSNIYMCGYDSVTLDKLKNYDMPLVADETINGVELKPSNLSLASSVGICLSERFLSEKYNPKRRSIADKKMDIFDYYTYVLTTPNELINGISDEAMSYAAHQKLNKLIILYVSSNMVDENTIDEVFSGNILKKYEALGFHTDIVNNMDDINSIDKCIQKAKLISDKPSIIEIKTSQDKYLDNNKIYSSYLTKEEITNFKNLIQVMDIPFNVQDDLLEIYRKKIYERSSEKYSIWANNYNTYLNTASPEKLSSLNSLITNNKKYSIITAYKDKIINGYKDNLCKTNNEILQHIMYNVDNVISSSPGQGMYTKTIISNQQVSSQKEKEGRIFLYGTRKSSAPAISNGFALSGLRPITSCKLEEISLLIPGIKQSSMSYLPSIYIFTYNSLQNEKEDYPISELAMLRSIPNLKVYTPCDIKELLGVWDTILNQNKMPSAIILPNENLHMLNTTNPNNIKYGAYIIRKETDMLDGIILSTGLSTQTSLTLANRLYETKGLDIRVVSMVEQTTFEQQQDDYKKLILPSDAKIIVFEMSSKYGIEKYATDNNHLITLQDYISTHNKEEKIINNNLDYKNIETKVYELFKL